MISPAFAGGIKHDPHAVRGSNHVRKQGAFADEQSGIRRVVFLRAQRAEFSEGDTGVFGEFRAGLEGLDAIHARRAGHFHYAGDFRTIECLHARTKLGTAHLHIADVLVQRGAVLFIVDVTPGTRTFEQSGEGKFLHVGILIVLVEHGTRPHGIKDFVRFHRKCRGRCRFVRLDRFALSIRSADGTTEHGRILGGRRHAHTGRIFFSL